MTLTLNFQGQIWKRKLEYEGQSTWNKRDMNQWDVGPIMRPLAITLTLDFHGQILEKCIPGIGGKIDMDERDLSQ